MTSQVLAIRNFQPAEGVEALQDALIDALADASRDRGERVHASELYLPPMALELVRVTLSDGSAVYNIRIRTAD